jgi:hypothetical protein
MQRMRRCANHKDKQRGEAGSFEFEAINEDSHSEELYQTAPTTRVSNAGVRDLPDQ